MYVFQMLGITTTIYLRCLIVHAEGEICMATYPSDAQYIWNFLSTVIGNDYGVAGLMGNMYAESGLLSFRLQGDFDSANNYPRSHQYTNDVDDGTISRNQFCTDSKGYGLCQWTIQYRKTNMYDFIQPSTQGNSISDLFAQLQFLMRELEGVYPLSDYSDVLNVLENASGSTPEEAIKIASDKVLTDFENPADQSDAVKRQRANYSIDIYNTFSGQPPVPPIPPTPPSRRGSMPLYFYTLKKYKQRKGLI